MQVLEDGGEMEGEGREDAGSNVLLINNQCCAFFTMRVAVPLPPGTETISYYSPELEEQNENKD